MTPLIQLCDCFMLSAMHSCTPSKNCMAIAQFYNIIDRLWKAGLLLKNSWKLRHINCCVPNNVTWMIFIHCVKAVPRCGCFGRFWPNNGKGTPQITWIDDCWAHSWVTEQEPGRELSLTDGSGDFYIGTLDNKNIKVCRRWSHIEKSIQPLQEEALQYGRQCTPLIPSSNLPIWWVDWMEGFIL